MLVVADTSPINDLILMQHELLLPALYTHVVRLHLRTGAE
jgi:hypothetical protein